MKKIFINKFGFALLLSSFLFISCDDSGDATDYSNLIVAEDVMGTITLNTPLTNSQTVREGDQGVYTYTVTLDKPQAVDIHVSVLQVAGDADDHDFEFDHEIIIPAYSTSASGQIKILNDDEDEETETFTLRVSNANTSNASIVSQDLSFTIIDCYSDLAGTYSYSTTNMSEPGGGSAAGPVTGTVTFTAAGAGVLTNTMKYLPSLI